jgi:hypothetical protein
MKFAHALIAIFLMVLAVSPARAALLTWTGAVGPLWSDSGNWQPSGVPASGDILIFPAGASNTSNTNDLDGLALDRIDLAGDGYVLGGHGITVMTIRSVGSVTNTLAMLITDSGGMSVQSMSSPPVGGTVRVVGGLVGGSSLSVSTVTLHIAAPAAYAGQILLTCGFGTPCGQLWLDGASMPYASVHGNLLIGASEAPHLFGSGTVGAASGVSVSPGSSTGSFALNNGTGLISTGSLALVDFGRSLSADIEGGAPGTGYDQIAVNGTVTLSDAQLSLRIADGFLPSIGQVFTIIANDGADPIGGTFKGVPQGSTVMAGGVDLQVSYAGGDGNDVTLTVTRVPKTWSGAASNLWSNPANWVGGLVPQNGDRVRFPAGALNLSNTNDIAGLSLHGLLFDGAGYSLAGNGVVITNAILASREVGLNVVAMPIDVQANAVTITPFRTPLRLAGGLAGSGPITVDGSTLFIAGAGTFSGQLNLACEELGSCGILWLEDATMPSASVSSSSSAGVLLGSGTIGAVSGVHLSPCTPGAQSCSGFTGGSPASLSTGSLSLDAQGLSMDIAGPAPGSGHDQVAVTGTVTLSGTQLFAHRDLAFTPTAGQVFTIISNDGTDAVNGRFFGLPQGGLLNLAGTQFRVSYAGGDGNDVTLTALSGEPRLVNISTRAQVLTGDDVVIAGFVIGGSTPKAVVVRARGPSLTQAGVVGVLANPLLQLFSGQTQIAVNDNWQDASNASQVAASDLAPAHPLESAILTTLAPGPYTAIMSGVGPSNTGIGIVEVFEAEQPEVPLVNIATRSRVLTGDNLMIAGFVIQGTSPQTVVVRARGPSLAGSGVTNALSDPVLSLYSGQNVIASNNNWQTASNASTLQSSGFAPADSRESAIYITLNPGAYTAIVQGAGSTTGVGIVEVFAVPSI